ncbi:hypothetical protein D6C92_06857 [Aureobasidium pullulans]|nr:hypothetical protein D6C92_06857 [Aureobasidium pullulans]
MPTSNGEALTLSLTSGPFRAFFFVRQRVCCRKPLPHAHDSHPGHSSDVVSPIPLCGIPPRYVPALSHSVDIITTIQKHIRTQVLRMKRKLEIYNVDSTKEDSNSAKRGRKDSAGLPRDDDRLFVTPDPGDPHKHHYFHREDIESTNPAGQDDRINYNILETDPGADEEAPKADD